MAMGKRERQVQQAMWVETQRLAKGPSHPFYSRLNELLGKHGFDDFAEAACRLLCGPQASFAESTEKWVRRS